MRRCVVVASAAEDATGFACRRFEPSTGRAAPPSCHPGRVPFSISRLKRIRLIAATGPAKDPVDSLFVLVDGRVWRGQGRALRLSILRVHGLFSSLFVSCLCPYRAHVYCWMAARSGAERPRVNKRDCFPNNYTLLVFPPWPTGCVLLFPNLCGFLAQACSASWEAAH